jgi:anaerobic magnesium-protoporphyrin IX monomethyl ester cyclase
MKIAFTAAIPADRLSGDHRRVQTMSLPLGPLYVATALKAAEPDIEIRFFNHWSEIEHDPPDILAIGSVTQNFNEAIRLAQAAKAAGDVVTIVGGPHISALPESLPTWIDYGIKGEGEETFVELVRFLKKSKKLSGLSPEKITGLVYHNSGKVMINPARPEIAQMDSILMPDRKLWAERLGVAHIMTSRGCPFRCSFCSEPVLWKKYRTNSVDYVLEEIRDIQRHFNPPHLLFGDDLFTVDRQRLYEMSDRFVESGVAKEMAFSGWGRVNIVDAPLMQALKKMNLVYMAFGIESASERVLKTLKPGVTLEMEQKAIDLCYDAGIKVGCTFIIASPEETVEDLEQTYQFIKRNRDKMAGIEVNPVIPLPGTPIWDEAFKKKLVSHNMNWDTLKDYSLFTEFDPEQYVILNPHFHDKKYQKIFRKLSELYLEYANQPEMMELIISYWNPKQEAAAFKVN